MAPGSEVMKWAVQLIRAHVERSEALRRKAAGNWNGGKHIHKLRTQARRLRAVLEDLCNCTPAAPDLLAKCKELSDATSTARDTRVMVRRLKRYRRFALPAERAEIKALCADLAKQNVKGLKRAKAAVKACRIEMQP